MSAERCHSCAAMCLLYSTIVYMNTVLNQSPGLQKQKKSGGDVEGTARKLKAMYIVYLGHRCIRLALSDL